LPRSSRPTGTINTPRFGLPRASCSHRRQRRHSIARKFFSSSHGGFKDDFILIARTSHFHFLDRQHSGAQNRQSALEALRIRKASMASEMPTYLVRHLAGNFEELSCLLQLEDESAAMYFNIVHGSKLRRKFTTENSGKRCEDYVLIAREIKTDGSMTDRAVALFDLT